MLHPPHKTTERLRPDDAESRYSRHKKKTISITVHSAQSEEGLRCEAWHVRPSPVNLATSMLCKTGQDHDLRDYA